MISLCQPTLKGVSHFRHSQCRNSVNYTPLRIVFGNRTLSFKVGLQVLTANVILFLELIHRKV